MILENIEGKGREVCFLSRLGFQDRLFQPLTHPSVWGGRERNSIIALQFTDEGGFGTSLLVSPDCPLALSRHRNAAFQYRHRIANVVSYGLDVLPRHDAHICMPENALDDQVGHSEPIQIASQSSSRCVAIGATPRVKNEALSVCARRI